MVAGGNTQVGLPKSVSVNFTGTTPRLTVNTLVPSGLMGGWTCALYAWAGVGVGVGVAVAVAVRVGLGCGVGVGVGVNAWVGEGVTVAVAVGVAVPQVF